MMLHHGTALPAINFLSVCLPVKAVQHIKQFSLFRMVAYLGPANPLYCITTHKLTNRVSAFWLLSFRATTAKYSLQGPLHIIMLPPHKASYQKLVCATIYTYWTDKLSTKASNMPRVKFFRTL